jgi:tetratricopeptide (TPR) repeat protein
MLLRPGDDTRHRTALLAWLAVGAVLRFAYLQEQAATSVLFFQPLLDEEEMRGTAQALLQGRGFGPEPLFKAPLYPILLAGVMFISGDGWFWAMRFLQHLLGVVLIAIGWDTAKRLLPPGRASFVAANVTAGILALYAPLIRLENQLILDSLVVVLQSAVIWSLLRMRLAGHSRAALLWAAAAGVLAALAWLNRPTITPVIPILALWIIGLAAWTPHWGSRALRLRLVQAVLFVAFPILTITLFAVRNHLASGEALLLPWQGSYSFYEANKPGATGRYYLQPGFVVAHGGNPAREMAIQGFERAKGHDLVIVPPNKGPYAAIDWYWRDATLRAISQPWSRWFKLMVRKTVYLGTDREIFNFEVYDIHKSSSWILRWLPLSFGWLFPLALASLAFFPILSQGRRDLFCLMWVYALMIGAAIALYFTSGRLRMPLVFPAAVLASIAVTMAWQWFVSVKWDRAAKQRVLVASLLVVVGLAWSWGDWWGVRSERLHFADYERLSNAASRARQPDRALEYADLAARENPESIVVPMLRGQALYALDRIDEAEAQFRLAHEAIRTDATSSFNLGIILYYDRGKPAEAREFFAEAIVRNPNYFLRARAMEALCALREGKVGEAGVLLEPFINLDALPNERILHIALIAWHTARRDEVAVGRATQRFAAQFGEPGRESLREELRIAGLSD